VRAVYDAIGTGYVAHRQADPRIALEIRAALDNAARVVNVGAGAGSYEPSDLDVVAVEPSWEMIRQRPPRQRPQGRSVTVQAVAERLPFPDGAFDAALAVLTVHHWADRRGGLAELARVARRVVVVTWDPACRDSFWLTTEYLPEIVEFDLPRFPSLSELAESLGGEITTQALPVPHDCVDGFLGAFWRRPDAYLDPAVRSAMSCFAQLPAERVDRGLSRLADDLRTERWEARFGHLRDQDSADLGYRLVVAEPGAQDRPRK
jgi:SAM-dependent methyltransferase